RRAFGAKELGQLPAEGHRLGAELSAPEPLAGYRLLTLLGVIPLLGNVLLLGFVVLLGILPLLPVLAFPRRGIPPARTVLEIVLVRGGVGDRTDGGRRPAENDGVLELALVLGQVLLRPGLHEDHVALDLALGAGGPAHGGHQ